MHWRTPLDIVIRQEGLARGPSAPFATGHRGGSSPTRRRNPLYAAADPPASGRCPTARGPSAPRRLGFYVPPHFRSRSGSSESFSISAVGTAIEDGKPD